MPKVGIVMGSDSDMKVMSKAADMLEKLGVEYEMTIISAHREPDVFFEYAKSAEEKDFKVIIAGAGMAAHLPGMCAAIFPMPVIGIPMSGKNLEGVDALYSIVQMPPGIPVATVAIDGGVNAAILAARILATSDPELLGRLKAYSQEMKETVQAKAATVFKIIVKIPLNAIKKIVGPSPIPSHTIDRGTQAIIGTCLKELINGDIACKILGEYPIIIPSGKPIMKAYKEPVRTRRIVIPRFLRTYKSVRE